MIRELETVVGCFFDRREDGRIHQKPFAGQSFDRTVHRGTAGPTAVAGPAGFRIGARARRC